MHLGGATAIERAIFNDDFICRKKKTTEGKEFVDFLSDLDICWNCGFSQF